MFIYTIGDLFSVLLIAVLIIWAAIILIKSHLMQSKCKHDDGVNETSACDAICRKCGKNLGFIGNWRK